LVYVSGLRGTQGCSDFEPVTGGRRDWKHNIHTPHHTHTHILHIHTGREAGTFDTAHPIFPERSVKSQYTQLRKLRPRKIY
jgi:hypothetical protein